MRTRTAATAELLPIWLADYYSLSVSILRPGSSRASSGLPRLGCTCSATTSPPIAPRPAGGSSAGSGEGARGLVVVCEGCLEAHGGEAVVAERSAERHRCWAVQPLRRSVLSVSAGALRDPSGAGIARRGQACLPWPILGDRARGRPRSARGRRKGGHLTAPVGRWPAWAYREATSSASLPGFSKITGPSSPAGTVACKPSSELDDRLRGNSSGCGSSLYSRRPPRHACAMRRLPCQSWDVVVVVEESSAVGVEQLDALAADDVHRML